MHTSVEDDDEYDDTKIVKSSASRFSRGTSWAYVQLNKNPKVVAVCFQAVAKRSRRVRRRFIIIIIIIIIIRLYNTVGGRSI